eukprot:6167540-Pleurochrysis_carterae.AAC.1
MVNGRGAGAGAAAGRNAPEPWIEEGELSGQRRPSRTEFQELGERSASAPQVCMRRESKTANSACEYQLQVKGARDDS